MSNVTEEARQQFGERIPDAMKLLEAAAKRAGYEFTDFNKAMKDGMFKPAVLMKEVGKLMRERANNNDALANSLKTSAVQQQRFTNAMKAFAGALLKSGLDQLLTDLFNTLTGIVKVLSPLVMWLAKGVSGIIAFAKGNKTLATAIGVVIIAFIALRSQIAKTLVTHVATMASMVASTYLASGAVGVLGLAFKALRVAIASTGLGLLLLGLVEAGTAYSAYLDGEDNWINKLIGKVDLAIARFKLLGSNIEYTWWIIKNKGATAEDRLGLVNGVPQPKDLLNSGKSNLAGKLPWGTEYMGGVGSFAKQALSGLDYLRNNYEPYGTPSASNNYSNITPATMPLPPTVNLSINNLVDGKVISSSKNTFDGSGVITIGNTVRN